MKGTSAPTRDISFRPCAREQTGQKNQHASAGARCIHDAETVVKLIAPPASLSDAGFHGDVTDVTRRVR